jgi:hypothetical protein
MILDMIQGFRYLRRSKDRWLLSKNSTTRLEGLESWHGAGLLWNCSIPNTNTKGLYLYPCSNTTPSRPRLQHLLPKINTMASCPSRTHHQSIPFFISNPCHHTFPNAFRFHPWNSSSTEWWCTPDRKRLYRTLWGKPSAEWCSYTKSDSHVSLFPVPILGVNICPFNYGIKGDFIPELTINTQRPQAKSVQHPFFPPSNHWSLRPDPNPNSSTFQASILKWWTKTKLSR